jgi:hypothetical protein
MINNETFSSRLINLVEESSLIRILRSYLSNSSIQDLTQRVSLYTAINNVIRALSACSQLMHLLMIKENETSPSIDELLAEVKNSMENYEWGVE